VAGTFGILVTEKPELMIRQGFKEHLQQAYGHAGLRDSECQLTDLNDQRILPADWHLLVEPGLRVRFHLRAALEHANDDQRELIEPTPANVPLDHHIDFGPIRIEPIQVERVQVEPLRGRPGRLICWLGGLQYR
jgi:hypothetical protein